MHSSSTCSPAPLVPAFPPGSFCQRQRMLEGLRAPPPLSRPSCPLSGTSESRTLAHITRKGPEVGRRPALSPSSGQSLECTSLSPQETPAMHLAGDPGLVLRNAHSVPPAGRPSLPCVKHQCALLPSPGVPALCWACRTLALRGRRPTDAHSIPVDT